MIAHLRCFALTLVILPPISAYTHADGAPPAPFRGKVIEFPSSYAYPMQKGAGYETVQKCSICHSFGYILNQGKVSRSYWEHETHKMVAAYKAPITPEEEKVIVDYLSTFYGNGK